MAMPGTYNITGDQDLTAGAQGLAAATLAGRGGGSGNAGAMQLQQQGLQQRQTEFGAEQGFRERQFGYQQQQDQQQLGLQERQMKLGEQGLQFQQQQGDRQQQWQQFQARMEMAHQRAMQTEKSIDDEMGMLRTKIATEVETAPGEVVEEYVDRLREAHARKAEAAVQSTMMNDYQAWKSAYLFGNGKDDPGVLNRVNEMQKVLLGRMQERKSTTISAVQQALSLLTSAGGAEPAATEKEPGGVLARVAKGLDDGLAMRIPPDVLARMDGQKTAGSAEDSLAQSMAGPISMVLGHDPKGTQGAMVKEFLKAAMGKDDEALGVAYRGLRGTGVTPTEIANIMYIMGQEAMGAKRGAEMAKGQVVAGAQENPAAAAAALKGKGGYDPRLLRIMAVPSRLSGLVAKGEQWKDVAPGKVDEFTAMNDVAQFGAKMQVGMKNMLVRLMGEQVNSGQIDQVHEIVNSLPAGLREELRDLVDVQLKSFVELEGERIKPNASKFRSVVGREPGEVVDEELAADRDLTNVKSEVAAQSSRKTRGAIKKGNVELEAAMRLGQGKKKDALEEMARYVP